MQALRWHGVKDVRVDDIAEPATLKGKVKIKVKWCGICGSDLHEYAAGPIFIPQNSPHPLTEEKAPIVMGHEFSGQVVEVGDGVTKCEEGDRVVIEPIFACGTCTACKQGKYNLCEQLGFLGLAGGGGGFSEYVTVDEHMVHKIPDTVSFEQGALVEPAAVALYAVRQSQFNVGDQAVVFGTGPIGLLVIEALKASGASKIYAVELSTERRQRAEQLGAIALNPAEVNVVEEIQRLTDGGADVSFEVTGTPIVLTQAIESTKLNGQTMIVSIFEKEACFQPNLVVMRERNIAGIIGYRDIFPAVISLMNQGYFSAETLVTKRIGLHDIVEQELRGFNERKKSGENIGFP